MGLKALSYIEVNVGHIIKSVMKKAIPFKTLACRFAGGNKLLYERTEKRPGQVDTLLGFGIMLVEFLAILIIVITVF